MRLVTYFIKSCVVICFVFRSGIPPGLFEALSKDPELKAELEDPEVMEALGKMMKGAVYSLQL